MEGDPGETERNFCRNHTALDGTLNVFQDIDDYMHVRLAMGCGSERFFLGANLKWKSFSQFFSRQHLGKSTFRAIFRRVCEAESIEGCRSKPFASTHGLRGTCPTLLLQAGHSDSSVALRTGHRDMRYLKSYPNLQVSWGSSNNKGFVSWWSRWNEERRKEGFY